MSKQAASEVEGKFEARVCDLYTSDGDPVHGEYSDAWYDDLHEVKLYVHVVKWPRGGDDWNALQRFVLHVDNTFRNFLDTRAEAARNAAARDDTPF